MDPSPLVSSIASHGLLGVILVIVGLFAWSKDRELKLEREARISDAKQYTDLALKLQAQVIDAVNKLADIFEEMRKMMAPPRDRPPLGGGR